MGEDVLGIALLRLAVEVSCAGEFVEYVIRGEILDPQFPALVTLDPYRLTTPDVEPRDCQLVVQAGERCQALLAHHP